MMKRKHYFNKGMVYKYLEIDLGTMNEHNNSSPKTNFLLKISRNLRRIRHAQRKFKMKRMWMGNKALCQMGMLSFWTSSVV